MSRWLDRLHEATLTVADVLFASPLGVLCFHRLCFAESILGFALLILQLVLFALMDMSQYSAVHWAWLVMVLVPACAIVLRLRSILRTHRRCEQIMGTFRYRSIIEDLEQLMQGSASRVVRAISAMLCSWFFVCILWLLLLPPCGDMATNPDAEFEFTFEVSSEKGPCVVFECTCTFLLFMNGGIVVSSFAVLHVLRRFPRNFSPPMGGALPPEFIERLPTHEIKGPEEDAGGEAEDRWIGQSCTICLQDFQSGETLRLLPCGHGFHVPCADGWLQRSSNCPMRCEGDLRAATLPSLPPGLAVPLQPATPLAATAVPLGASSEGPDGAAAQSRWAATL